MTTRPFKEDLALARKTLEIHATPFEVFVYRVYEWRLNTEAGRKSHKDIKYRNNEFLPSVVEAIKSEAWAKEYDDAMAKSSSEDEEYWGEIDGKKVRQAWIKVSGLIYYVLDTDHGGDMIKSDIARKYEVRKDFVTRAIQAVAEHIEPPAPGPRDIPSKAIPLPLDYESGVARQYYSEEARFYYVKLLEKFLADEDTYEIENPIVATLIHQLILNTYTIQTITWQIDQGGIADNVRSNLLKRLEELQKTTGTTLTQMINIQKELGRLEKKEESLGALKRRLEEVRTQRAEEVAEEVENENQMYSMMLMNCKHLGIEQ